MRPNSTAKQLPGNLCLSPFLGRERLQFLMTNVIPVNRSGTGEPMARILFPFVSAAVCLALVSRSDGQTFDAAAYKRLIIDQRSQITSMYGVFTAETRPDSLAEKAGMMRQTAQRRRVAFAWSGDRRYLEETTDSLNQDLKPSSNGVIYVFDGNEFRKREKNRKIFRIQKSKSADCELNPYLSGGLKWPMTNEDLADSAREPGKSNFLPYFLEATDWSVRPEPESIDGVDCVVLEQSHGGRRLWLDPLRGYCMLKMVHDRPGTSNMLWVNRYSDFREVLDGIFLPMKAASDNVRRDEEGNSTGTLTTTIVVDELRCNDVPEGLFTLEPQSGDWVFDEAKGLTYQYLPDNGKTLDTAASDAKAGLGYAERRRPSWQWGYFSIASVVGLAIGWWTIKRLRH
jgi:hypothetical protein